ncbi:MAG: tetratricopeptide repeat protein [bacterium]|nr:tetratricopeptide repeat protein [bacterium]
MSRYDHLPHRSKSKELLRGRLPLDRLYEWIQYNPRLFLFSLLAILLSASLIGGSLVFLKNYQAGKTGRIFHKINALHQKGLESFSQGKWEEASGYFKKASEDAENPLIDFSRFYLALCNEKMGKKEEALALYEKVEKEGQTPSLQQFSKQKKVWLSAGF